MERSCANCKFYDEGYCVILKEDLLEDKAKECDFYFEQE